MRRGPRRRRRPKQKGRPPPPRSRLSRRRPGRMPPQKKKSPTPRERLLPKQKGQRFCRVCKGFDAHRSRSDQLKPYAGNLGGECGDSRYDEDITIKRIGRRRRPRGCFSAGQCRLREYKKLPPLRNRLPLRYDKKSQPPPPPRLQ